MESEEIGNSENFENEMNTGLTRCAKARKDLMAPRLTSALDKCKISDRDPIHIITACIEDASLNIRRFLPRLQSKLENVYVGKITTNK